MAAEFKARWKAETYQLLRYALSGDGVLWRLRQGKSVLKNDVLVDRSRNPFMQGRMR